MDIQFVLAVDQQTCNSLQKSGQLAITSNSQQAATGNEAKQLEQESKGLLEQQKIVYEAGAVKSKKDLKKLQSNSVVAKRYLALLHIGIMTSTQEYSEFTSFVTFQ